jgi:hypothetical protein
VKATTEIDAQTRLGEIYMSSLLRTQFRLALAILFTVAVTVLTLPIIFTVAPDFKESSLLGMPTPWVILAFGVYPLFFGLGWAYVRRAERNERAFSDVVEK